MLLIFLTAGAFVGVVGRSSAQSVAYFMLDIIPARFAVAVLFVVACFVSTAMGTSVGTITLIMPIALEVAQASGFDTALCTGSVVGGAMFGDNLSFISDTTIAACNGQGCAMKDKFKGNFWIALPAAIATLVLILLLTMGHDTAPIDESYDLIQILPYVLVLAGGVAGINVFIVLLTGIVSGAVIMLLTGQVEATALLASMGNGAAGMFETSMVAILVAAMCALIRVYGGFDALLCFIRKVFRGKKGRPAGHGSAGGRHGHRHRQQHRRHRHGKPHCQGNERGLRHFPLPHGLPAGHLLLHFQGIIPYGAQMLVAISAAAEMGFALSAFSIMRYLFYPYLLLVSSLIAIFLVKGKEKLISGRSVGIWLRFCLSRVLRLAKVGILYYNERIFQYLCGGSYGLSGIGGWRCGRQSGFGAYPPESAADEAAVSCGLCGGQRRKRRRGGHHPNQADSILDAGADIITMGNHTWSKREIVPYMDDCPWIIRPANYAPQVPGRGWQVVQTAAGDVAVIDLIGRCNMDYGPENPFLMVDKILKQLTAKIILVEIHAEATSEKLAMGYMLDGRVSAVWGTHTHVPRRTPECCPRGRATSQTWA